MRYLLFSILVGLISSCLAAEADLEFQRFKSKDAGFSVSFPGRPKHEAQSIETPAATLNIEMFHVEPDRESSYSVVVVPYPRHTVSSDSPEAILERVRDGAVRSRGKLLSDSKFQLAETYPGREYIAKLKAGSIYRSRIFLVENTLYQLVVVGPEAVARSDGADKFFDSFELTSR